MAEPYIGEISIFAGNFNPSGWAYCQGQMVQITTNPALYSLLGTYYGGDGRTTFGLPDLRDRSVIGGGMADPNTGRSARSIGQFGGSEQVTLNGSQMPVHNHLAQNTVTGDVTVTSTLKGSNTSTAGSGTPGGVLAIAGANVYFSGRGATANTNLDASSISNSVTQNLQVTSAINNSGGNLPHDNMHPWLCLNYIIALSGIYPSRE